MALVLPMFAASVHVTHVNLNVTGRLARGWTRPAPSSERGRTSADRDAIGAGRSLPDRPQPAVLAKRLPRDPDGT